MINSTCKYICIAFLLILCGCSGNVSTPVEPLNGIPSSESGEVSSTHSLMGIWDVEFDVESMEASVAANRDLMFHFNVGAFLPAPIVGINSWDAQNEIIDVDVMIQNTSIYYGYDVRMIVFYDDVGHRLMNADNFTHLWDIPAGLYANGFKAYAKDEQYRKFRSLQIKVENFQILCPNSNFSVQIAIDASYPGNCDEPYLMENFRQGALIEYVGAAADVRVDVFDWQSDVDSVRIQCEAITGEPNTYFTQEGSKTWKLDLVNNTGASEGEYPALLVATSANSGTLQLLHEVIISVYTADNVGWARTWGGVGSDHGYDIAVDDEGSIYVTGGFFNSVDFNPDPNEEEIRTSNGMEDIFLVKFDKYGDFKWVKTFGGDSSEYGFSVDFDNIGFVYVSGAFQETVNFHTGGGTDVHVSNGSYDCFLTRYSRNGVYIGTVTWGGGDTDSVTRIHVDNNSSVLVTGYFWSGLVDFDPDPIGEDWQTSNGCYDAFLSKFDLYGDFKWVGTWGGSRDEYGKGVYSDSVGNVYCSGFYKQSVDFDPGPDESIRSSNGGRDAFLSKFDSNGNFEWVGTWGGVGWDEAVEVAVDEFNEVYVTGRFYYTVDFDPDPIDVEERTAVWFDDAYVSKFSSADDFIWVLTWGDAGYDSSTAISTNRNGYFWVYGEAQCDFDPGPGVNEGMGNYISKFDIEGNYIWTSTWEKGDLSVGCLETDVNNNAYIGGWYNEPTQDFDPGPNKWNTDNYSANWDCFVVKILPNGLWQ